MCDSYWGDHKLDDRLKPCPFCKGDLRLDVNHYTNFDGVPYVNVEVECQTCGLHIYDFNPAVVSANPQDKLQFFLSEEAAIGFINCRPVSSKTACPFCASPEPILRKEEGYIVFCQHCGVVLYDRINGESECFSTKEDALKAWRTRK